MQAKAGILLIFMLQNRTKGVFLFELLVVSIYDRKQKTMTACAKAHGFYCHRFLLSNCLH